MVCRRLCVHGETVASPYFLAGLIGELQGIGDSCGAGGTAACRYGRSGEHEKEDEKKM
jgi:hypothetical protein